jgi:hypothetical protein
LMIPQEYSLRSARTAAMQTGYLLEVLFGAADCCTASLSA